MKKTVLKISLMRDGGRWRITTYFTNGNSIRYSAHKPAFKEVFK